MELLALVAAGTACSTVSTNARTLDPGSTSLTAGVELNMVRYGDIPAPIPQLDAGARFGVVDGFDLGVKTWGVWTPLLYFVGVATDAKIQLVRSASRDTGVDLALDAMGGYQLVAGSDAYPIHTAFGGAQLLIGLNIEGGHSLVIGPTFLDQLNLSQGSHAVQAPFGGSSLAFYYRVDRMFLLAPEVALLWSPVGTETSHGTGILKVSLGLLYDL
jgi:hypothetical protein